MGNYEVLGNNALAMRLVNYLDARGLECDEVNMARALDWVTTDLYQCDGCHVHFHPTRTPRKDRRNYCLSCRVRKVPDRNTKRRARTHE